MQKLKIRFVEKGKGRKMFRFEDIGDKGMKILLYLYVKMKQGGSVNMSDLFDRLRLGKTTVYRSLGYMLRYGLIEEERRYGRIIRLTEKGVKIAEHVFMIEKELGGDPEKAIELLG